MRLSLALVAAVALSACYSPSRATNCTVQCGAGAQCPEGYSCGDDNYCHVSGMAPSSCSDNPIDGGSDPDAGIPFVPVECEGPDECTEVAPEGTTCRCGYCAFVDFECPVSNLRYADAETTLGPCVAGVTDIDLGYQHSCVRRTDGSMHCWGLNCGAQLGNGDAPDCTASNVNRPNPTRVLGADGKPLENVSRIGTTFSATCAAMSDGTVWCWGDAFRGALGDGNANEDRVSAVPVQVVDGSDAPIGDVDSIVAGGAFACAHKSDDTLVCWGDNGYLQLGSKGDTDATYPYAVGGPGGKWRMAAAGSDHMCGAPDDGSNLVQCWGRNNLGQLGHTLAEDMTTQGEPVTVIREVDSTDLIKPAALGLGTHMSCAGIIQPDKMWCWGQNASHALGDDTNIAGPDGDTAWSARPVVLDIATTVQAIGGGQKYACGVLQNGDLYCWGGNDFGQTGGGTMDPFLLDPVKVRSDVRLFAAGYEHACAVTTDNSIYCWGNNVEGQVGDGTYQQRNSPALVGPICP